MEFVFLHYHSPLNFFDYTSFYLLFLLYLLLIFNYLFRFFIFFLLKRGCDTLSTYRKLVYVFEKSFNFFNKFSNKKKLKNKIMVHLFNMWGYHYPLIIEMYFCTFIKKIMHFIIDIVSMVILCWNNHGCHKHEVPWGCPCTRSYKPQSHGSPNFEIFGTPKFRSLGTKWHLGAGSVAMHKKYYKGESGESPKFGP